MCWLCEAWRLTAEGLSAVPFVAETPTAGLGAGRDPGAGGHGAHAAGGPAPPLCQAGASRMSRLRGPGH